MIIESEEKIDDIDYSVFCKHLVVCLDLYIKQHRGSHALYIGLRKHSARSLPSLTQFSLLVAETFDEDCYSDSGLSRDKRFGHAEAYNRLVRGRIVYRCRITESEPFRDRT